MSEFKTLERRQETAPLYRPKSQGCSRIIKKNNLYCSMSAYNLKWYCVKKNTRFGCYTDNISAFVLGFHQVFIVLLCKVLDFWTEAFIQSKSKLFKLFSFHFSCLGHISYLDSLANDIHIWVTCSFHWMKSRMWFSARPTQLPGKQTFFYQLGHLSLWPFGNLI